MIEIKATGDHYAVLQSGNVVGVVKPAGHNLWSFHALVGRSSEYVSLECALREAQNYGKTSW